MVGIPAIAITLLDLAGAPGGGPRVVRRYLWSFGASGRHEGRHRGSAEAIPTNRRPEPNVETGRRSRRSSHQASRSCCDRALCSASAPTSVGSSRCFRPLALPGAGQSEHPALCLSAVRRRSADLYRLFLRAAGGNNRTRHPDSTFRHGASAERQCVAVPERGAATGFWLANADNTETERLKPL